jgi:hypothetical protein
MENSGDNLEIGGGDTLITGSVCDRSPADVGERPDEKHAVQPPQRGDSVREHGDLLLPRSRNLHRQMVQR